MTETVYEKLDERLYKTVLPNGLTVAVVPRPGFSRKLAYFVTDMGSIHREFELEGQRYTVPAGIAHYLEHKLFDMPQRDISAELAELGFRYVRLAPELYVQRQTAEIIEKLRHHGFTVLGRKADNYDQLAWQVASGIAATSGTLAGVVVTDDELIRDCLAAQA